MLAGTYDVQIDSAGRLTIPARLRDALGDEVMVTTAFPPHRHLLMFDAAGFEAHVRALFPLPTLDLGQQSLKRLILGNAFALRLDKAGRVLIPQNLRDGAQIGSGVRVVGMDNYAELWAPQAHEDWARVANSPEMLERTVATLQSLGKLHEDRFRGLS